jgi:hypothetical protein
MRLTITNNKQILTRFEVQNNYLSKQYRNFNQTKSAKRLPLIYLNNSIGCSFKFFLKVGVEESIVNAPLARLQSKNTNNAKSEVKFKQLIRDL